jgi:iron complex outermembrane receptor protein
VNVFPENAFLPIDSKGDIDQSPNPTHFARFPNGAIDDVRHVDSIPSIELSSIYKGLDKHLFRFSAGLRYEETAVNHLSNYGKGIIDVSKRPPVSVIDARLTNVTGTQYAFLSDTHRSIWSLMLQDEWQIADDWQLTAGVRYDHYSDFGNTVNPRFALVWDINEQLTSKLLYGKAFRAPSFTELGTQNNPILLGNPNLKPEVINTVEWAFDYRPFSSLRTALNFYYYHINDLITTTPFKNNNSISQYNNFGNQDGYGSELELNWKLSEQWNLSGNYAWQYSRSDHTKARVTGVPEHQVYFAATWQFMPKWQFQSQLKWIGKRTRLPNDTRLLKDYETIDFTLRGNKLWGHLNLAASLRNAFDSNNLEPIKIEDLPVNLPLPGRNFYLEASIDF